MAKYFIRYTGHVIQKPGIKMPHEIHQDFIREFEKEDGDGGLKQFVNQMVLVIIAQGGMAVLKNPNKVQDGSKVTYDQRMVVPMHMIGYIDCIVRRLEEPKPQIPELLIEDEEVRTPATVN